MQIWRGRGRAGGRDCCLWDVSGYRRVFGAAAVFGAEGAFVLLVPRLQPAGIPGGGGMVSAPCTS